MRYVCSIENNKMEPTRAMLLRNGRTLKTLLLLRTHRAYPARRGEDNWAPEVLHHRFPDPRRQNRHRPGSPAKHQRRTTATLRCPPRTSGAVVHEVPERRAVRQVEREVEVLPEAAGVPQADDAVAQGGAGPRRSTPGPCRPQPSHNGCRTGRPAPAGWGSGNVLDGTLRIS